MINMLLYQIEIINMLLYQIEIINMLLYQILACTLHGKIKKNDTIAIDLKRQLQRWMKKNWLLDESYYVSDIQDYLNISLKYEEKTDNHSIRIYVNLTFKLKKENDLELVSPETIKLLRTIKVR